jgi:hypothetical protein
MVKRRVLRSSWRHGEIQPEGAQTAGGCRKKSVSKKSKTVAEAILPAAKQGEGDKLKGELVSYFTRIARTDPESFVTLLEQLLDDELREEANQKSSRP